MATFMDLATYIKALRWVESYRDHIYYKEICNISREDAYEWYSKIYTDVCYGQIAKD